MITPPLVLAQLNLAVVCGTGYLLQHYLILHSSVVVFPPAFTHRSLTYCPSAKNVFFLQKALAGRTEEEGGQGGRRRPVRRDFFQLFVQDAVLLLLPGHPVLRDQLF